MGIFISAMQLFYYYAGNINKVHFPDRIGEADFVIIRNY